MLQELKEEASRTRTENGAATLCTTGSECLDLFAAIGALRNASEEEIALRFLRAYAEEPDLAMKLLFYARDIRGGIGERRVFRVALRALADPSAFAERYQALREEGRLEELKKQGACVQLNFRPAGGKWHQGTARWCRKILRRGLADFLGTDMHNTEGRGPETERAVRWMEKELSSSYIEAVLKRNAMGLLEGKEI